MKYFLENLKKEYNYRDSASNIVKYVGKKIQKGLNKLDNSIVKEDIWFSAEELYILHDILAKRDLKNASRKALVIIACSCEIFRVLSLLFDSTGRLTRVCFPCLLEG